MESERAKMIGKGRPVVQDSAGLFTTRSVSKKFQDRQAKKRQTLTKVFREKATPQRKTKGNKAATSPPLEEN
jgi:hypothetical protein